MVLLIPDKKCLVLQHKNFFVISKKHNRLLSGTSGTLCKQSSPFTMWRLSLWGTMFTGPPWAATEEWKIMTAW